MTTTTYNLTSSIQAHGETVAKLELREPTMEMIGRNGLPYLAVGDGIDLKMPVILRYISQLAGIPTSSVEQMSVPDLNNVAWVIVGFFLGSGAALTPS